MSDWGTPDGRGEQRAQDAVPDAREDVVRRAALKRIKSKQDFGRSVTGWLGISALTTVIWVATGAHRYFWPIWPMLGVGIGVVAQAASIWGPGKGEITEEQVQAEMRRLQGPQP